jgi:hypothetical protein
VSNSLPRLIVALGVLATTAGAQARVSKYGYPEKRAPQPTTAAITEQDLMTRLYVFADDSMQGRQVGRVGNMRGTNYIARELRRLGLQPAGDSGTFFQRVPMIQRRYTERSTITVDGAALRMNADFVPTPAGMTQAPVPIRDAQVVYAGNLGDASSLLAADQAGGKFLIFTPAPDGVGGRGGAGGGGGRGGNPGTGVTPNACFAVLNPVAAQPAGRGGAGGRGGGGGQQTLASRFPSAAGFGIVDLDLTPVGRRAFINEPQGTYAPAPPPIPRAPIVFTRDGVIGTVSNGQVAGGRLPDGMTPTQLQRLIDSTRADTLARMRRLAAAGRLETVRACATADSIAVSFGAASMMGPGGLAAAEAAAQAGQQPGGGRGGNNQASSFADPSIATIRLTRAAAERLLGRPVDGAAAGTVGKTITATLDFETRDVGDYARNVVAVVPGSDPSLKGQYVLVSAHNDHVGFSTAGGNSPAVFNVVDHDSLKFMNDARTRLQLGKRVGDLATTQEIAGELAGIRVNMDSLRRVRPARLDSINNGADDDGSGSMAILEIAEYIARMPVKPKRSTIFVWQTGEEGGLRGSAYFATHPTVPIDSIVANINIDMIGRGRADEIPGGGPTYVAVVGSGFLSSDLAEAVATTNQRQKQPLALDPKFDLPTDWPGYNSIYTRSDHYNYARQCIPIAFFFTGLHGDYHQRTDEPQYIDYPHYTLITNYIRDVVVELGTRTQRPSLNRPCLR